MTSATRTHTIRRWQQAGIRFLLAASLCLPALSAAPALRVAAAPAAQTPADEPILGGTDGAQVVGRYYRQTGGETGLGYDVREPFYSQLLALGGTDAIGYPVSVPFTGTDGCAYQDFQRVLLQQCPGQPPALANTFQILEQFGADPRLQQLGIGPGEADTGRSFQEAVQIRLEWLTDPDIRQRYLDQCGGGVAGAAIQFCGLPMNHPTAAGPFVSQRFQRIAFQRWVAEGPGGIKPGDITAVLGGDLLKEAGVLAGDVVRPHATGQAPQVPAVSFTRPAAPATPTPTATPSAAQRTQPLSFGFQADFFNAQRRPQAIGLIRNAGFGWTKQQVVWRDFEIDQVTCLLGAANCVQQTVNGRTKYFKRDMLGLLDAVINDISASGLRLMVSVVRSPAFYAAPGGEAPANPAMLGDFVQFLVGRYRGKIQAVEPWNEQNLAGEWGGSRLWPTYPAPPPQGVLDFIQLQKAAYEGIRAADPTVLVILPALTPTGAPPPLAIDDRDYLDFLLGANGGEIMRYYDVLGVHPSGYNNPPDDFSDVQTVPTTTYKGHPSFYVKRYQQLHDVQVKYGDTRPMWFTEVGWSSTRLLIRGYEYGLDNSEAQRGRYFARLLEQVNSDAPYVTNVMIWNLNFRMITPEIDEKYGFGVVNADGSATPAYTCLSDFVRSGNRITRAECRFP